MKSASQSPEIIEIPDSPHQGRKGCVIIDARTRRALVDHNGGEVFPLASVVKPIILVAAMRANDLGLVALEESVDRDAIHAIPGSYPYEARPRDGRQSFRMGELLEAMVGNNDSVLADYFLDRLGLDWVQRFCHSVGMKMTSINSTILGLNLAMLVHPGGPLPSYWDELESYLRSGAVPAVTTDSAVLGQLNTSTPHDMSKLFLGLLDGTLLSAFGTEFALGALHRQVSTERMPHLLSERERAHMGHAIGTVIIGERLWVANDVGYFRSPRASLSLAFLSDHVVDSEGIDRWIAESTRDAVAYAESHSRGPDGCTSVRGGES